MTYGQRKITIPNPVVSLKKWRLDGQVLSGVMYDSKNTAEFHNGEHITFYHILYVVKYPDGARGPAFRYARSAGGLYIKILEHEAENADENPKKKTKTIHSDAREGSDDCKSDYS